MKRLLLTMAVSVLVALPAGVTARRQATSVPASLAGFSDEGGFVVYTRNNLTEHGATVSFTWRRDGAFENRRTVTRAAGVLALSTKVVPDKDGRWEQITIEMAGSTATVARIGAVARVLRDGQTRDVALPAGAALYGGQAPALLSQSARLYDRTKGGKQRVPLFRLDVQDVEEASLELKDTVKLAPNGRQVAFARFSYALSDVQFSAWLGEDGKVYLQHFGETNLCFVREGYEQLCTTAWGGGTAGSATPLQRAAQPNADDLLAAALKQAQAETKIVFIEFGASWCPPCQRLLAFLNAPLTRDVIEKHFVVASLTVSETGDKAVLNNPGAKELMNRLGGTGGIPFYAFLDAAGKQLADASSIGFPAPEDRSGVADFVALLVRMAPSITTGDRATVLDYLTNHSHELGWTASSRKVLFSLSDEEMFDHVPAVAPDGNYLAFVNSDGELSLHDIATGDDRVLSSRNPAERGYPSSPVFARAASRLVYAWDTSASAGGGVELRLIDNPTAGAQPSRRLFGDADIDEVTAHDWSPDGQWVATDLVRKNGAREIGLVSARDGALRVLTSLGADRTSAMAFSPDGNYLAFDRRAPGTGASDVMVVTLDSRRVIPAVVHPADDNLVGWSPDGEHLLFTSNRSGSIDLWAAFFHNDSFGALERVTSDIGRHRLFGLSTSGSLYSLVVPHWASEVMVASIDFSTGLVLAPPVPPAPNYLGRNAAAAWSPDGKHLAYRSDRRDIGEGQVIVLLDAETGQTREFRPAIEGWGGGQGRLFWSPDGRAIAVGGEGGFHRIDTDTGRVSLVAQGSDFATMYQWASDGRLVFSRRAVGGQFDLITREVASGSERVLLRLPGQRPAATLALSADGRTRAYVKGTDLVVSDLTSGSETTVLTQVPKQVSPFLSPDGRYIATAGFDASAKADVFLLIPTDGSRPRQLPLVGEPKVVPLPVLWAPDGRSIVASVARARAANLKGEYWWIPIDGRGPRKLELGLEPTFIQSVVAQPGGQRVAFVTRDDLSGSSEVWAIEFRRPERAGR